MIRKLMKLQGGRAKRIHRWENPSHLTPALSVEKPKGRSKQYRPDSIPSPGWTSVSSHPFHGPQFPHVTYDLSPH